MRVPSEAMPIVKKIRRAVKRPGLRRVIPLAATGEWNGRCIRGKGADGSFIACCPMGLLPDADVGHPYEARHFCNEGAYTDEAVQAFAEWWDAASMVNIRAAMDAVWPRKRKAAK